MNSRDLNSALYKYRRITGDLRAIAKGPAAYGARVARRIVYRHAHRAAHSAARRILGKFGL